jgi:thiopeptide-type bacteriocin biosynthesis protein
MNAQKNLQINFFPGDEWLYLKIYGGVRSADKILATVIAPISKVLLEEGMIDQWFFIRYKDPEEHLRIRFHLLDFAAFSKIISMVRTGLEPMIASKRVWNVNIDTYQREIERYGLDTMELAESFFCVNSELVIDLFNKHQNEIQFFAASLLLAEKILSALEQEEKRALVGAMQNAYHQEFNVTTATKRSLVLKFKNYNIIDLSENHINFKEDLILKQDQILTNCRETILNLSNADALKSLFSSFVHMSINRCFCIHQRIFEMMIYDFISQRLKNRKC